LLVTFKFIDDPFILKDTFVNIFSLVILQNNNLFLKWNSVCRPKSKARLCLVNIQEENSIYMIRFACDFTHGFMNCSHLMRA